MNMIGLLQELRQCGISLSLQGEQLKIAAPVGALTAELRERLIEHKPSLLQWLREQSMADESAIPQCQPDPDNLYEPFPLTDLQLGFFMADDPYMEFHVRPHYYNEIDLVNLDVVRYEAAWAKALLRHHGEIVIVTTDGRLQTVENPEPLRCVVSDLRDFSAEEVESTLAQTRAQMMRSELPIHHWPWLDLRATLWCEQGTGGTIECARIHYNHNNFFSDGYGTTRLLQEVEQYYRQPEVILPALSLSYRDSVLALEELSRSPAGNAAQRYWEERMELMPEPPSLPQRTTRNRRCRSRLQRRDGYLSAESWRAFKTRAAHFGITPSNAVFAIYAEIVAAWSNSRHYVLSNMMTRRLNIHPEIRDILGNFASLYPLEVDCRQDDTFVERARRLQEQVISDSKRLQWGGMQVMQTWNRRKGAFGSAAIPFVVGSGLFMENFKKSDFGCLETSQVMLDHQFSELDDGRYWYVWDVLEEFFLPGVLDHMQQSYHSLLERLITEPDLWRQPFFHLLPQQQLDARARVTPPAQPMPDICLDDFLRITASRTPEKSAVWANGESLDFAGLKTGSARIAQSLRTAVTEIQGRNIVIIAERGLALVQAVYAVLQVGAAYVPVDPELPEDRRRYIIENSQAAVVLAQQGYVYDLGLYDGCVIVPIDTTGAVDHELVSRTAQPQDLAYLIYTSGSTGRPKGVMIEHQAAVNTVLDINRRFGVTEADRIFGVSSFGFDLSVYDLFGSVASGATLVYPDPQQILNPSHWLDLLLQQRVSIWNSAPPLALLLIETAELRGAVLPDLRLVMLSGDWIPIDLPTRIKKVAPNARVVSLGGATEASIWSIFYEVDAIDPEWQSIPYGYPMTNQPWYVLDAWGRPTPDWTTGELYIGGVGLARGYWNDKEKTEASFIPHPVSGERIYRTGDIGRYQPGGVIEFLGRRDLQVKIQGHRIELGEIESLLSANPDISAAVAVVHGSNASHAHLLAYVVPAGAAELDTDQLRQELEQKLPGYMVPRAIHVLDHLPLSSNGKVDRKALPDIDMSAAKNAQIKKLSRGPMDEMETGLLSIWRVALNQPELTVSDDFFDVGGQSFEAVRVVGAIREKLGKNLSIGVIWQERTVERVAAILRRGEGKTTTACRVPLDLNGSGTPLYLVHPAGGHVMCYRKLASLLDRPVIGFQAPGIEGDETPLASIEALAIRYVTELEQHQPHGPLLLGGWSSGALIAFAMAAELHKKGRAVAGIVMFDCPAPLVHTPIDDQTLLTWFLEDLALDLPVAELIEESFSGSASLPQEAQKQIAAVHAILQARGHAQVFDIHQMTLIFQVFSGIVRGSREYHAPHVDVNIFLVRAENDVVSEFADHPDKIQPQWGWNTLCKNVTASSLPGSHYSLLSDATIARLAHETDRWCSGSSNR